MLNKQVTHQIGRKIKERIDPIRISETTERYPYHHPTEAMNNNSEHECNLLNQHELSRSQKYELQRFIDQNSYLLRSPSSQDYNKKKEKKRRFKFK
uniref:Uncharacterized protein n=1 Tax=Wuchereria bancrofti TaxID=6293 RepID=A0AAF5Q4N2_WUCBA